MDGLCWITGCATIRLGGETVALHALRLCDYALIESEILRRRGNPFDLLRRIAASFPKPSESEQDVIVELFQDVERRWCHVSFDDLSAWLDTWPGRLFGLWLMVRRADPGRFTLEFVQKHAAKANWREIQRAIQIATAEDERGTIHTNLETGDESARRTVCIPWSVIFQTLASNPFSMTVEDIGNLTLRQLEGFLSPHSEVTDRLTFETAADFERWRGERASRLRRVTENIRRGHRWDAVHSQNQPV